MEPKKLKVLFYGTHLKHYYLAKWLNERGHDCTLYLDEEKVRNLPEASDESLVSGYPHWIIKKYEKNGLLRKGLRFLSRSQWLPFKLTKLLNLYEIKPPRRVIRMAEASDVVFTSGPGNVIKALSLTKPVVFRALGSDLTQMPFASSNLQRAFLAYYFRKNIRKLSKILIYQEDTYWAARLLKVVDKVRFFSVPTDLNSMERNVCRDTYAEVKSRYSQFKTVFFLPARKNMDGTLANYKGLDKALRAIKHIRESGFEDFVCVATNHGWHFEEFRSQLESCGLADKFEFIGPQPLTKLSAYLTQDNFLTINDVGYVKSHLTGIGRECVSLGGIMVDSVQTSDPEFLELYGKDAPAVYSACTEDEIAEALKDYITLDSSEIRFRREALKGWAYNSLHWENNIRQLEDILYEAHGQR